MKLCGFEAGPDQPFFLIAGPCVIEGEALVLETRNQLTQLFLERGAAHLQIGRTYRYREGLRPEAWRLLEAIKATVDPRGLVNPGVLGLGGDDPQ
jgi:hypothetical protein